MTILERTFDEKELATERTLAEIVEELRSLQQRLQIVVEDAVLLNADAALLAAESLNIK